MLGGGGAGLLGLNPDMVAGGLGDAWQGDNRLAPQLLTNTGYKAWL